MLHMKTIYEIRYDNLKRLVDEAGGLTKLCERSKSWLHENSENRLSRPTLDQILKKRTTRSGSVKGIGDELARKLEDELRLEPGFMDNPPEGTTGTRPSNTTPLVRLIQAFEQLDPEQQENVARFAEGAVRTTSAVGYLFARGTGHEG